MKTAKPGCEHLRARLISIDVAATELGVSTKTVRRQIMAGELNAYRVGRCLRVAVDELDRFKKKVPGVGGGDAVYVPESPRQIGRSHKRGLRNEGRYAGPAVTIGHLRSRQLIGVTQCPNIMRQTPPRSPAQSPPSPKSAPSS